MKKYSAKLHSKAIHLEKISVLIPVRNEGGNIKDCLSSLEIQLLDKDYFEIIIINDHSTDNTVDVVENYMSKSKLSIHLFHLDQGQGKKDALKHGVEKAKHATLATTDADCFLPDTWLSLISNSTTNDVHMLLGPVMFSSGKGLLHAFQTLDMLAIQGMEFGLLYFNQPVLNNAANLAYKTKIYQELGGYDHYETPSGDDIFLLEKFINNAAEKVKGLLLSAFIVETKAQETIKEFWNQRIRWASKTKHYKSKVLIGCGLIVFFQNMSLIFIYYQLLFVENSNVVWLILLFTKWLFDFILLFLSSSFFNRKKSLLYFIPVQIIYPIYVVCVGICSKVVKFEWKEREFNG